jgi:hypothetical protein
MAFVGFGGFNRANQAAILQQQIADQQQAQNIFRQIAASQTQYQSPVPSYQAPGPSPIQSFQQMGQMMMMMMSMMQSMAQLGGGFSSFLGGPNQPQYPTQQTQYPTRQIQHPHAY